MLVTEKQNIHDVSFPFIQCHLGVGGVFVPLTEKKNSYYGNISQESLKTTIYIARVFINVLESKLEAVSHKKFHSFK